jgi:hypothetical protein
MAFFLAAALGFFFSWKAPLKFGSSRTSFAEIHF